MDLPPDRLLRRRDVMRKTSMTTYMIDLQEECGGFPRRIRVGQRTVYWSEAEIDGYIAELKLRQSGTRSPQTGD